MVVRHRSMISKALGTVADIMSKIIAVFTIFDREKLARGPRNTNDGDSMDKNLKIAWFVQNVSDPLAIDLQWLA